MKKIFTLIKNKLFLDGPEIVTHPSVKSSSHSENKKEMESEQKNVSATDKMSTLEKIQVQTDKADRCRTQHNVHQGTKNVNSCRLFLGGIPDDVTETDLRNVFEKYGKIKNVHVVTDKNTNKSKRFGFLEFENEESANESLNHHFEFVNGRRVEIKQAWPRGCPKAEKHDDKKETNYFVNKGKIPSSIKDLDRMTNCSSESTAGTDRESNVENDQPKYRELFNDYFKTKYTLQTPSASDNALNVPGNDEVTWERQLDNEVLRKLLTGFYRSSNEESSVGENHPDFSSSFDDTDSTEDDVDYYFIKNDPATEADRVEKLFQPSEESVCRVCDLRLSPKSAYNFFAHCQTPIHKQRMKERFEKNEILNRPQQNKKSLARSNLKSNNMTSSQSESVQVEKKKNTRRRQRRGFVDKAPRERHQSGDVKEIALEEILTSLQVETDKCLKCKICNKNIPQAADLPVLMANLFNHLQSKKHLAKIRYLENSSQIIDISKMGGNSISGEMVNFKSEKNYKNSRNKKECETRNAGEKFCNESSGNAVSPNKPKVTFRCLYCNYFCSKPNTFLNHINSDSHLAKTDVKSSSAPSLKKDPLNFLFNQLTTCPTCEKCFCGPPVEIKNHFIQCDVQKLK